MLVSYRAVPMLETVVIICIESKNFPRFRQTNAGGFRYTCVWFTLFQLCTS